MWVQCCRNVIVNYQGNTSSGSQQDAVYGNDNINYDIMLLAFSCFCFNNSYPSSLSTRITSLYIYYYIMHIEYYTDPT